jgi:Domain of Unknown Function (DUF1259)
MNKLVEGGPDITALHNHLLRSSPATLYMHVRGNGDPVKLATTLHAAEAGDMSLSLVNVSPDNALQRDAGELDPPAGRKVDVRGLPRRRAELARLVAWREALVSELEILGTGRRDLADHIKRLEREMAKADADAAASADSVLSRIRQGLSWSINPSKPSPDYSTELQIARTTSRSWTPSALPKMRLSSLLRGVSRLR